MSFFIQQKTVKRLTWPARLLILCLLLLFIALTHRFWLTLVGSYLVYTQKPARADIIIVQGGGDKERIEEAAWLYHRKYARRILISGNTEEELPQMKRTTLEELARKEAIAQGVAASHIILEGKSKSTHEGALLSRPIFEKQKVKKAIIVSEPYHLRRSYLVYQRVYRRDGLQFICHSPSDSWYRADNWWEGERGLIATCNEYIKLIYYLFKGYI